MPVSVQVEAGSEALAEGDARALGVLDAQRSGLLALPALKLLH